MINKQVMGGERAGKAWGREEPSPAHPRTGSWRALYRKDAQERLSSGGSLEPRCLRKIFTCIHHTGAGCTELPGGHLGDAGAISP